MADSSPSKIWQRSTLFRHPIIVRVVVSGGTGFIGRALAHALVGSGVQLIILTRGPARDTRHACSECGPGGKVEFVSWTPEASGAWMDVVDGADAVVNFAGAGIADARWTRERKQLLRSSRIETTSLLVRAIEMAKRRPSVFVSTSAVGLYGTDTGDRMVSEDAPVGSDFLATLAKDWEATALRARPFGVRVVIPRFGLVLGRSGGAYKRLAPLYKAFVGGPVGDGSQYVPWVHLRDAVRVVEAMIERPDFEGAYNVVAPEPVTMDVFASELGRSLNRPSFVRVPPIAMKLAMGAEAAEMLLTGQRAVPRRLVDAKFAFVFPELRSAFADLAARTARLSQSVRAST